MSVQSEITRIQNAVTEQTELIAQIATALESRVGGGDGNGTVELPELGNEGSANDLLTGKELIDGDGNVVVGNMPVNQSVIEKLHTNRTKYEIPIGYHDGSGIVEIDTELKEIIPTKNSQDVDPSDGRVLSKVIVKPIPDNYQDVTSVTAGADDVISGKTIVDKDGNRVVGTYIPLDTSDATAKAEDIMDGKTAYVNNEQVVGTFSLVDEFADQDDIIDEIFSALDELDDTPPEPESDAELESFIQRTITQYSNPELTAIGSYAFCGCSKLTSVYLPKLIDMGGDYAFGNCTSLVEVCFPELTIVSYNGFRGSAALVKADFHKITRLGQNGFYGCKALTTLIIRTNSVCVHSGGTIFTNTPIASGTGYVYVPRNLVDSYKTASNWVSMANQIRAIEDYPEICGV